MTYLYIGLLICIIFAVVGYFSEKKFIWNPLSIFCGLWAVILYFSSLQKYTMYTAGSEKNYLILIGIISYICGYYLNKIFLQRIHFRVGKFSYHKLDINYKTVPRYNLLYVLGVICLFYTIYTFLNVIRQSGTLNLGIIQSMLQSGDIISGNSSILNALAVLIISPVKFVLPAIAAIDFWFGKRDKKLLCVTICLVVVSMLSTANRTSFMLFFLWLIAAACIYLYHSKKEKRILFSKKPNSHLVSKIRKYMILLTVVGISAFVIMTVSRGASSILKQLYLYFSMPPSMFEIWAGKIETEHIYGYGLASLLGFVYPIFYVLKNILGLPIPHSVQLIYDWTMLTDTLWVWPGRDIRANAYVSVFWFLYLDGRAVGVVIGMLLFGMIVSRSYNNVMAKIYSERQLAVYCIILYIVLFSFVRLQFTLPKIALGMIFVMFFAYRIVPKSGEDNKNESSVC